MSTNESTRRRLLTTGLAAGVAATIASPGTANAAPGGNMLISRTNDAGQDAGATYLVTDSDKNGFHVNQKGTGYGIWGVSVGGPGMVGRTENSALTGVRGVNGATTAGGGCGVRAIGTLQHGLRSDTNNAERWGAIAENLGTSLPAGGQAGGGLLALGGQHGVGVYGQGSDGVVGEANSALGFGLIGKVAPGSTEGAALYARGPSILEGFTAVDKGLDTLGPQTYLDSAFLIPHPAGSDRYLQHSAVHSAERKNIYDGTATLDAEGKATVTLPAYVAAVNGSFRYQLTPIGAAAPSLHISREFAGNSFGIAGGNAGQKVCWTLTGVRTDRYATDNPLQIEFGLMRAATTAGSALANRSGDLRKRRAARLNRPAESPQGE